MINNYIGLDDEDYIKEKGHLLIINDGQLNLEYVITFEGNLKYKSILRVKPTETIEGTTNLLLKLINDNLKEKKEKIRSIKFSQLGKGELAQVMTQSQGMYYYNSKTERIKPLMK